MNSTELPRPRLLVLQATSIFESYGGIEYYLDDLLTLITELYGPESVHALVPHRNGLPFQSHRPYSISAVPFHAKGLMAKFQNRFSPRLLRTAFRTVKTYHPNLLVCGHVSLGPLTYLLHRFTGLPYIMCTYGIECWGKLAVPYELALRSSRQILTISHWTKGMLVRRGLPSESIAIVHPRLPSHLEQSPPPGKRSRPESPFRLLTVSRLDSREQYKGQDHVIEALHRLRQSDPDLRFHYTIQGDGDDRSRLAQLVQSRGLENNVTFQKALRSREDLDSLYRETDLFVMPARFGCWGGRWRGEGFGIVYLEAAAFGVPSVAYNCGGVTDIIRTGINGILVQPDSIGDLASTLSSLARNPKRVNELGRNAYESVMRDFTRTAIRTEIHESLKTIGFDDLGISLSPRHVSAS